MLLKPTSEHLVEPQPTKTINMPPKRRQTKNKAPAKLSAEDQYKREQCDLLLMDFDQLYEEKMKEAEGEMKTLISNLQTMYRINGTMKLSSVERKTNWNEYVKSKGMIYQLLFSFIVIILSVVSSVKTLKVELSSKSLFYPLLSLTLIIKPL